MLAPITAIAFGWNSASRFRVVMAGLLALTARRIWRRQHTPRRPDDQVGMRRRPANGGGRPLRRPLEAARPAAPICMDRGFGVAGAAQFRGRARQGGVPHPDRRPRQHAAAAAGPASVARLFRRLFRLDRGGAPALYANIAVAPNGDELRSDLVIVQRAAPRAKLHGP